MSSRAFVVHSPLSEQLEFRSMEGTQQILRLFEFRVRLLSDSPGISAKSLLGKDISIGKRLGDRLCNPCSKSIPWAAHQLLTKPGSTEVQTRQTLKQPNNKYPENSS